MSVLSYGDVQGNKREFALGEVGNEEIESAAQEVVGRTSVYEGGKQKGRVEEVFGRNRKTEMKALFVIASLKMLGSFCFFLLFRAELFAAHFRRFRLFLSFVCSLFTSCS